MHLCVNVGNTSVQYGLFDGQRLRSSGNVPAADVSASLFRTFLGETSPEVALVASVAPSRSASVLDAVRTAADCEPLLAGASLDVPIEVRVEAPERVGIDRLLNALAAHRRTNTQCIVVDVGTAVTIDVVTGSGAFCGGAIAPGPALMVHAMHQGAELLPDIAFRRPQFVIGRNTEEAMLSGAFWATVGMVERLIREVRGELIGPARALGTGGAIRQVASYIPEIDAVVPELTLEGLRIAFDESRRERTKRR